jgi:Ca2+-binding RTX toxin-like protein
LSPPQDFIETSTNPDPILSGEDVITGDDGENNLQGGEGNDTIDGGEQDDLILGGAGDDLINGGNGNDILNGGADIFAFNTLSGSDTIIDFSFDEDHIGLSDGITFDDLIVTQGDGAVILSFQDQAIASISGGTPSQINASLFTTI